MKPMTISLHLATDFVWLTAVLPPDCAFSSTSSLHIVPSFENVAQCNNTITNAGYCVPVCVSLFCVTEGLTVFSVLSELWHSWTKTEVVFLVCAHFKTQKTKNLVCWIWMTVQWDKTCVTSKFCCMRWLSGLNTWVVERFEHLKTKQIKRHQSNANQSIYLLQTNHDDFSLHDAHCNLLTFTLCLTLGKWLLCCVCENAMTEHFTDKCAQRKWIDH